MKWPFSYRSDLFWPVLAVSISSHAALLGISSSWMRPATYSVVQAPTSVDVVLIKEEIVEPPQIIEPIEIPMVQEVKEEVKEEIVVPKEVIPLEKEELAKTLVSEEQKGAITEALPSAVNNPAPVYPYTARREGWEGLVVLKVLVEADGWPAEVIIEQSSGYTALDNAAFKTVEKWQFTAARRGPVTFSSWITIPIRFNLIEE